MAPAKFRIWCKYINPNGSCSHPCTDGEDFRGFHPVAVLLSYMTKAPLVPPDTPVVNALSKQRAMLENIMRACVGLPPDNNMMMEFK